MAEAEAEAEAKAEAKAEDIDLELTLASYLPEPEVVAQEGAEGEWRGQRRGIRYTRVGGWGRGVGNDEAARLAVEEGAKRAPGGLLGCFFFEPFQTTFAGCWVPSRAVLGLSSGPHG
eukprot:7648353-Pyramimonas_sp.AAC.1